MRLLLPLLALLFLTFPAHAQDEEKGRFTRFVEDTLSSDTAQIRLNGLEGTLSSNVRLQSITVADQEGVYLTIENPQLEWSRSALLRGKLDIEKLTADAIVFTRTPKADESLPDPEAGPLTLPDLPVKIEIDELSVGRIAIAEEVFGQAAEISLNGNIVLDDGRLDAKLAVVRLDGPGGNLNLDVSYSDGSDVRIDVVLEEPADGIVANLANIEGRPPIRLAIQGQGPLNNLTTNVDFAVDGNQILGGTVVTSEAENDGGTRIVADLGGPFASILPSNIRPFVGGNSTLDADVVLREGGGVLVNRFALDSGAVSLAANALVLADGFLSALNADLEFKDNDGQRVTLNLSDRQISLADGGLTIRYDAAARDAWNGTLTARDLRTAEFRIGTIDLTADGTVTGLQDPANRAVTFRVDGTADDIGTADAALSQAIGKRITLTGSGDTRANQPVNLNDFTVTGETFSATVDGLLRALTYEGDIALQASRLDAFSALANRELAGATDLTASGTIGLAAGSFDLLFDGTANDLKVSVPRVDPLLAGRTTLSGRAARGAEGLSFENLAIRNDQVTVDLNGRFASDFADLKATGRIENIGLVEPQAQGAITFDASVSGQGEPPFAVTAEVAMPSGSLADRAVERLRVGFDGTTDGASVDGDLSASGFIGGESIALDADIAASAEEQALTNLDAKVGNTAANGSIVRNRAGLLNGRLRIDSSDISAVAALALQEASGAIEGTVELSAVDGKQSADADIEVRDLNIAGNSLGQADIEASARDLFGTPAVDAELSASDIAAGGVVIRSVDGTVATEGNRTAFDVRAELAQANANITARGAVVQEPGVLTVTLDAFDGRAQGAEIGLAQPTTVTVRDGTVSFDDANLRVGDGSVRVSGSAGEQLDITAAIDRLPLDIANAVAPDLGLAGRVSGNARVTGTAAAPDATFDISGEALSAAALRNAGIEPLAVEADGRFAENTLTLNTARITNPQGVSADLSGTLSVNGGPIDLSAEVNRLPLAIANVAAPDLDLAGTVSGTARATGTLANPNAEFDVEGQGIIARPLAQNGIQPLTVDAAGTFADRTLRLSSANVSNGQGIALSASGTVPLDGGALDVNATLNRVPLAVANVAAPNLDLAGTISGTARATGTLANPNAEFDLNGTGITARPLAQNGVAPLSLDAAGTFVGRTLRLTSANVSNSQGLALSASGTVPLDGGQLDVNATLNRLPLSLANAVRPDLGAQGTITGDAAVRGTITDPQVAFDLEGSGISVAQMQSNGVQPVTFAANGSFIDNTVRLDAASVRNGQGIDATASGTIPLQGAGLNVSASGTVPASLANGPLASRGATVAGTVRFDASVTGSLGNPNANGLVSLSGGTITDPLSNLRLENVGLLASLDGDTLSINEARANLSTGGSVSIDGTVGIAGSQPVNLTVVLNDARYSDGQTVTTTASGTLTVTGSLAASPLLAGTINLARTEITVPENFGGAGDLLEVRHIQPPADVRRTLGYINQARPSSGGRPEGRPSILRLDVLVNAPNQIFVRGRGLDAELGGSVRVRGPINAVQPEGRFELIRGRLSIIGRRINLEEGTITLTGDLDPTLNFVASVQAGDITAFIRIRGRASDLEVTFDSDPDLPEDEVLAQVVFGRSLTDLSPVQIARLASIAAELTGGSSPGLVDGIRAGTGLDDLDVTTDADGNAAVQAGKYISDEVYLGVQAGQESKVTINIDITDEITARGAAGTDGNSEIGIFYEKDY